MNICSYLNVDIIFNDYCTSLKKKIYTFTIFMVNWTTFSKHMISWILIETLQLDVIPFPKLCCNYNTSYEWRTYCILEISFDLYPELQTYTGSFFKPIKQTFTVQWLLPGLTSKYCVNGIVFMGLMKSWVDQTWLDSGRVTTPSNEEFWFTNGSRSSLGTGARVHQQ